MVAVVVVVVASGCVYCTLKPLTEEQKAVQRIVKETGVEEGRALSAFDWEVTGDTVEDRQESAIQLLHAQNIDDLVTRTGFSKTEMREIYNRAKKNSERAYILAQVDTILAQCTGMNLSEDQVEAAYNDSNFDVDDAVEELHVKFLMKDRAVDEETARHLFREVPNIPFRLHCCFLTSDATLCVGICFLPVLRQNKLVV